MDMDEEFCMVKSLNLHVEDELALQQGKVTICGIGAYGAISIWKNESKFYKNVLMPVVHLLDGETSHKLGVLGLKYRLLPPSTYVDPPILKTQVYGLNFPNPIGIAAGFDKNAEAILGLNEMGFGFIEVGSVTPQPQDGNAKPRVFRLKQDKAVINRYGFNNDGAAVVYERVRRARSENAGVIIGVNLGKNKASMSASEDYISGLNKFWDCSDYLVINVSSPNTPGLRDLQKKDTLNELLSALKSAPVGQKRLFLKLAPDLSPRELRETCEVILKHQIDGLIISNTTIERPLITDRQGTELGGLSGSPLRHKSTDMIRAVYQITGGTIPIIGVGGVFTGQDAYEKIRAGASLVQIYTGLMYEGPPIVAKIKKELADLLVSDGFHSVGEAVGADH